MTHAEHKSIERHIDELLAEILKRINSDRERRARQQQSETANTIHAGER